MARYFFGATLAAFRRTAVSYVEATAAGEYDSAFVPCAIQCPNNIDFLETFPFLDGNCTVQMWLRFDVYPNTATGFTNPVEWVDSSGIAQFRLNKVGSTDYQFQFWNGSAWVSSGPTFGLALNVRATLDVKIVLGASGVYEVWKGVSTMVTSGSFVASAAANINRLRFRGVASYMSYSEILCGDFDTRGHRYKASVPTGDGSLTDGTGDYTLVDEAQVDDSDAIELPVVGNQRTFTKPAIVVPVGQAIHALCIAARGRVGGTPTDAKLIVKSGATVGASAGKSYSPGYEPRGHAFALDPNTAAAWTETNYNAAEPGVEAA